MPVDFSRIAQGKTYSRHGLAELWGYKTFHPLARGVVTPAGDNNIVLFITKDKQEFAEPYVNDLEGSILRWEGPTDHFAESRMVRAKESGDKIHAFYRDRHHSDFTYLGEITVVEMKLHLDRPSSFVFDIPVM
jgi:hypothetical protein